MSSIKPIDADTTEQAARDCKAIVTVEEHQVMGGMGSAIAETLAQNYPVPMEFIGIQDKFGQSGTPDELIEHYGMGKDSIKVYRICLNRILIFDITVFFNRITSPTSSPTLFPIK